jgi:hypothetical protein
LNSGADNHTALHLSKENSHKILGNMDITKKMDAKIQKCPFDRAKQLKLKEVKSDSNPVCINASSSLSTINW